MDSRLSRESIADRERNSGSVRDYVVVILIAVACVPFIVANFVIIINCNFKPVKTRNASLTVMSSLGGLIWLGATIVVNDHFERREHTVWTICPLWTFWLQACFGFALWLNCMTLHLVRLYILLIRKKNLDKRNNVEWITTRLLLLLSPTIVACICATAFRAIRFKAQLSPVKEAHRKGDCEIQKSVFSAILISLLPLYFVIFLGFAFKLRNIMAQYNEFRQIRNGGIMSLFLYLLYLVTLQTKLYIQPVGRCFIALSVAGAVFYYFWARNGEIVYNVLFNKLEYEKKFLDDLNRSSYRQSELHCDSMRRSTQHLLHELKEDVLQLQPQISQLAEQNQSLKQSIHDLHNQIKISKYLHLGTSQEEIQASKRDNVDKISEIHLMSLPFERNEIFEASTS